MLDSITGFCQAVLTMKASQLHSRKLLGCYVQELPAKMLLSAIFGETRTPRGWLRVARKRLRRRLVRHAA